MAGRVLVGMVCAGAALCSGCGTLLNTAYFLPCEGGQRVYGGVRLDWDAAVENNGNTPALAAAVLLADLPLSLVGDTLTLPYTLALAIRREGQSDGPGSQVGLRETASPIQRVDYEAVKNRVIIQAPEAK